MVVLWDECLSSGSTVGCHSLCTCPCGGGVSSALVFLGNTSNSTSYRDLVVTSDNTSVMEDAYKGPELAVSVSYSNVFDMFFEWFEFFYPGTIA